MSTKIFDGCKVHVFTIEELFAFTHNWRSQLLPVYEILYFRRLAAQATHRYDLRSRGLITSEPPTSYVVEAFMEMEKAHQDIYATQRRNPAFDFDCEITFLIDPENANGPMYARFFSEQADYNKLWETQPEVEPYPYWNNTDRPDDCTQEEWDMRAETWDRVLGWNSAQDRGITWTLIGSSPHTFMPKREKIAAQLPSTTDRARRVAAEELLHASVKEGKLRFPDSDEIYALAATIEPTLSPISIEELF